jgi:hypothetical protein
MKKRTTSLILIAGAAAAAVYLWTKVSKASQSSLIGWNYQGPPQPKATSTGKTVQVTLAPGTMKVTWPVGATGWFFLPAGASWSTGGSPDTDPQLFPTSLGGDVVGGQPPNAAVGISGLSGSGTAAFHWTDSGGMHETLVDVRTA